MTGLHVRVAGAEHGGEARGFFLAPAAFAWLFKVAVAANDFQRAFAVDLLLEPPQGLIN